MTIQRYWNRHGNIEESEVGAYVLYADHLAAMQRERECREKLVKALDGLFRTVLTKPLCPFGIPYSRECQCNYHADVENARAALAAAKGMK